MKSGMKLCVVAWVALLAVTMIGMTFADEPVENAVQGSWNDYPAKRIGQSTDATYSGGGDIPTYTIPEQPQSETPSPPLAFVPEDVPPFVMPPVRPPMQQQQSYSGGGLAWGGGIIGGGFNSGGGKTGGNFNWGGSQAGGGLGGGFAGGWGGGQTGGGFNWGGGKTGGGFNWGGGKTGGGLTAGGGLIGGGFSAGGGQSGGNFGWGKTSRMQCQQGWIPNQCPEQIRQLQLQNAMLKEMLRLAAQQSMND